MHRIGQLTTTATLRWFCCVNQFARTDNSGVHDVASGMTFRRTEGTWNSGMDVAANFRNGSKNVPNGKNGCPNPSYFNEFSGNKFEVGHRAPHLNPAKQERDNFWSQPVSARLLSMMIIDIDSYHSPARCCLHPAVHFNPVSCQILF
jgi:hypothetical protein